ncbi:MAG: hypothetical protein OHK0029_31490 [Armatimonadaceae bacterium]
MNRYKRILPGMMAMATAVAITAGCTLQEAEEPTATPAPMAANPGMEPTASEAPTTGERTAEASTEGAPAGPAGAPMAGGAPMMGMADPRAPLSPTPEMDEKIETATKSGDKAKLAAAYTERGLFRMYDDKAGARVKYRAALSDFRKALAAQPDNTEAQKAKKQIEDIYQSMGMPIPSEDVP